jgi:hypothetical protein
MILPNDTANIIEIIINRAFVNLALLPLPTKQSTGGIINAAYVQRSLQTKQLVTA